MDTLVCIKGLCSRRACEQGAPCSPLASGTEQPSFRPPPAEAYVFSVHGREQDGPANPSHLPLIDLIPEHVFEAVSSYAARFAVLHATRNSDHHRFDPAGDREGRARDCTRDKGLGEAVENATKPDEQLDADHGGVADAEQGPG